MCSAGFPEPYTFSLRARRLLDARRSDFDLIHDNQCLGSGLLGMMDDGWPVLATLHHPITVDRDLDLEHATSAWRRFTLRRWYGFLGMQMKVARAIPRVVTVSRVEQARHRAADGRARGSAAHRARRRRPADLPPDARGRARARGRLMTTTSADVPMKGLVPLLEALAKVRTERDDAELVIIGKPKDKSKIPALIERLGLTDSVRFVSGVDHRAHRRALRRGRGRGRAVALRGLLAPGDRGHGVRRPARRHHRRRAARGGRHRRRDRPARPARRPRRAGPHAAPRRSATPICGPASARPDGHACSTASPGGRPRSARSRTTGRSSRRGHPRERPDAHRRLRPVRPPPRPPAARHGLRRRAPRVRRDAPRRHRGRARLQRRRAEGRPRACAAP